MSRKIKKSDVILGHLLDFSYLSLICDQKLENTFYIEDNLTLSIRVFNIFEMIKTGNDIKFDLPMGSKRHPEARGISRGSIYVYIYHLLHLMRPFLRQGDDCSEIMSFVRRSGLIPLLLLLPIFLSAQTIKPENPIQFKIKNAGITVDGTISDWELDVDFDAKKLAQSSIKGTANPAGIQTGIKLRDKHLQGREYFNTQKFAVISLKSKSFRSNGKNAFVGIFELQIRDVIREVEIPFTLTQTGKQRKFKGEFVIDRLDFGLGEKSLVLSDEVRVVVEF